MPQDTGPRGPCPLNAPMDPWTQHHDDPIRVLHPSDPTTDLMAAGTRPMDTVLRILAAPQGL